MGQTPLFSRQFLNVLVITNDIIDETIRGVGDMAATDYCILQELIIAGRRVGLAEFNDFLLLRKNTVSIAASRLEARGYVSKEPDKADLRKYFVVATSDGAAAAADVSAAIREHLLASFWRHEEDERVNWGMVVDSGVFAKNGLGVQAHDARLEERSYVLPAWIMALRYIEQLWTATLRSEAGLPLGAYRVLDALTAADGPLYSLDIARMLRMDPSFVSQAVRLLRSRGLVETERASADKRFTAVSATEEGERAHRAAFDALEEATERYYEGLPADVRDRLASWHDTMQDNFEAGFAE